MKCVDKEGHEYEFIGYMVVCEKLAETTSENMTPGVGKVGSSTVLGMWPVIEVPAHFAAKIEVHQCKKCGNIQLQQAVFSRILGNKKKN